MTDNRKAGSDVFGTTGTGPKFIISACKNQSPSNFVVTLIHSSQLCPVCIQFGVDTSEYQIGRLGLADVLLTLLCQRLAQPPKLALCF
jgi:hypothetical protein